SVRQQQTPDSRDCAIPIQGAQSHRANCRQLRAGGDDAGALRHYGEQLRAEATPLPAVLRAERRVRPDHGLRRNPIGRRLRRNCEQ
ncbi:hypothetical protein, partial [Pontibaca methylaminivorans]|uniref:hypothetical protein n=1 Tax=Pontibaca methylaminivorans TaxID=515897 RepID=UPI002FD8BF56